MIKKFRPYILLVAIAIVLCSVVQFSFDRLQQDDYFHIKVSRQILERGLSRSFPWAKHTDLNKGFADLYFLYHVLLLPFCFGNLVLTAKIAGIVFAALSVLSIFWFLRRNKIRYAFFWSLLFLVGSNSFFIRQLAVRPISVAIIFYVIGLQLLIEKRYLWLILVSYLFVLTYTAFPLFVFVVLVYAASVSFYQKKIEFRPVLFCFGGTLLGIVVNPYFPNNLKLLVTQIFKKGLAASDVVINLEWMPLSSWALFLTTAGILAAFLVVILLSFLKSRKHSLRTLFLLVQSAAFLLLYFKFARGVDQFVPFAVLFCASAFDELDFDLNRIGRMASLAALVCIGAVNTILTVGDLRNLQHIDNSKAALWLKENSPAKSEVFITNYGAFPELFFYNTHNVYTFGFDAVFLREHNPRLYDRYLAVLQLSADPYPIIKEEFGASYVHIENLPQTRELYRYLSSDPSKFVRVYQDSYTAVFRVI